jgi:hypothetical protein
MSQNRFAPLSDSINDIPTIKIDKINNMIKSNNIIINTDITNENDSTFYDEEYIVSEKKIKNEKINIQLLIEIIYEPNINQLSDYFDNNIDIKLGIKGKLINKDIKYAKCFDSRYINKERKLHNETHHRFIIESNKYLKLKLNKNFHINSYYEPNENLYNITICLEDKKKSNKFI